MQAGVSARLLGNGLDPFVGGSCLPITAIPELLKVLELKGCIVAIDAMGCQETITQDIVDGGGEFITRIHGLRQTNYSYNITGYILRRIFSGLEVYPV